MKSKQVSTFILLPQTSTSGVFLCSKGKRFLHLASSLCLDVHKKYMGSSSARAAASHQISAKLVVSVLVSCLLGPKKRVLS